jgi:hypothetical protein
MNIKAKEECETIRNTFVNYVKFVLDSRATSQACFFLSGNCTLSDMRLKFSSKISCTKTTKSLRNGA